MTPKTITVLGANGTVGSLVSGIVASFGNATVYLVSRSIDKSNIAAEKASNSIRADSTKKRLISKTYEDLEKCVKESDWVIEAVTENIDLKKEMNIQICKYRKPDTLVSTVTSGFSIEELSESLDDNAKKYYMGIHFFNPPYNLTLCELIPTKYNNPELITEVREYLEKVLYRDVVIVKDKCGFLGNRIGFYVINEALQYAEKYKDKGGIDYIDQIVGPFIGIGMPPIMTADFVGLDIHKAIVDNIYNNISSSDKQSFKLPSYVNKLIDKGYYGKKVNCGFYKTNILEDGKKEKLVYDIKTAKFRLQKRYKIEFIEEMKELIKIGKYKNAVEVLFNNTSEEATICKAFLIKYVTYSLSLAQELTDNVTNADVVMTTGFNWAPPIGLYKLVGKDKFSDTKINNNISTTIDYRRFLKSK